MIKQLLSRPLSVARDLYTYRYFNRLDKWPRYRGVYSSRTAAESAIPKGKLEGFNLESVPTYFLEKQFLFNPSDYPVLFWLSQALERESSNKPVVFDLGGGVGQAYYIYQRFLRYPEGLQWIVCDVESFVARGAEFAVEQGVKNLSFTTDRQAANAASIYMTCGTLHYVEPDLPEIVAQLSTRPRHVLVSRVPMYHGEPYYTVQASEHSYLTNKVTNISRFVQAMEALGYETVDRWELPRRLSIPFHPDRLVAHYRGFYFRLR
jgi:putative methyltransferase (TIGR04325 family)